MRINGCLCCDSKIFVKKGQKRGYNIYRCEDCKFEFVYPLQSSKKINEYYKRTKIPENLKQLISTAIHDLEYNPNYPKRDWFNRILNYCKKHLQNDKLVILEVGSAYGLFVHYVNSKGHKAVGAEVNEEYASSSKGLIKGDILFVENHEYNRYFTEETFDLIYLEHVLEHLTDPSRELEKLRPLLKSKGLIFISVPNHRSILSKIYGLKWAWTHPPDHLHYFNETALVKIIQKNNLEIIHSWTGDYFFRSIYQFYSLDMIGNLIKKLLNKLLKTNFNGKKYSYRYPKSFKDRLFLLPYWLFLPIIRWSNKKGMGSELIVIAKNKGI